MPHAASPINSEAIVIRASARAFFRPSRPPMRPRSSQRRSAPFTTGRDGRPSARALEPIARIRARFSARFTATESALAMTGVRLSRSE